MSVYVVHGVRDTTLVYLPSNACEAPAALLVLSLAWSFDELVADVAALSAEVN